MVVMSRARVTGIRGFNYGVMGVMRICVFRGLADMISLLVGIGNLFLILLTVSIYFSAPH